MKNVHVTVFYYNNFITIVALQEKKIQQPCFSADKSCSCAFIGPESAPQHHLGHTTVIDAFTD